DDSLIMRVLQCVTKLGNDLQCLARLEMTAAHDVPQIGPIHKLHDEVVELAAGALRSCLARFAEIEDADDVRMVELRERAGLAREALGERGIAASGGRQYLERYRAIESLLPRSVHRAHPALPDQLNNLQLRKVVS